MFNELDGDGQVSSNNSICSITLKHKAEGRTIRKVMGVGGRGIFSMYEYFSLLTAFAGIFFFQVKPSARFFFRQIVLFSQLNLDSLSNLHSINYSTVTTAQRIHGPLFNHVCKIFS